MTSPTQPRLWHVATVPIMSLKGNVHFHSDAPNTGSVNHFMRVTHTFKDIGGDKNEDGSNDVLVRAVGQVWLKAKDGDYAQTCGHL